MPTKHEIKLDEIRLCVANAKARQWKTVLIDMLDKMLELYDRKEPAWINQESDTPKDGQHIIFQHDSTIYDGYFYEEGFGYIRLTDSTAIPYDLILRWIPYPKEV